MPLGTPAGLQLPQTTTAPRRPDYKEPYGCLLRGAACETVNEPYEQAGLRGARLRPVRPESRKAEQGKYFNCTILFISGRRPGNRPEGAKVCIVPKEPFECISRRFL